MEKVSKFFTKSVNILFAILMVGIMFATVVIDKNINSLFPNTVDYPNEWYYFVALLLISGFIFFVYKFGEIIKTSKSFYICMIGIFFVIFII